MTIYSSDYSSSSGGSSVLKIQPISSDNLANDWNYCILSDTTSGNITITLPLSTANSIGKNVIIKKIDNSSNIVCIKSNGTDTLNGSTNPIYLYGKDDCISILSSDAGECETLPDNRSNVGQSKSYLISTITAAQTTNIGNGDHIKFNSIGNQYGSDIILDTTTTYSTIVDAPSIGRFTLKSGKTYRCVFNLGEMQLPGANDVSFAWYNATTNQMISLSPSDAVAVTQTGNYVGDSVSQAVFTPTIDTKIELRLISGTITSVGFSGRFPTAYIECLTTPANVINTVDYLFAKVSANVTTANTIIPVTSVVGNIPVSNNMFSLIAGKTYELEAFIEFNGNTGSAWAEYVWTDSSGTYLPTCTTGLSVPVQATSTDSSIPTKAIITPTQNMSVKVMTTGTVAGIVGIALTRSYFKITQIGSTAQTTPTYVLNTEYLSPEQHGGIYGTVYRQYFNASLSSSLTSGNNVAMLIDYAIRYATSTSRNVTRGWGNDGTSAATINLTGTSGNSNLALANSGSIIAIWLGWVDYTK